MLIIDRIYHCGPESEYAIDCFSRARERHNVASAPYPTPYRSLDFALQAAKIRTEGQIRAVREFELREDGQELEQLVFHLLLRRQYHTFRTLFDKGVNFLERNGGCNTLMHIFVQAGLASLVREIGDLEVERQFPQGRWHAFNDSSKTGLYRKQDSSDGKSGPMPSFLLEAVNTPQPNMEVVRLLVERYHVDWSSANHQLAKGRHWWHVAQALPYLISKGANISLPDPQNDNRTPIHIALGGFAKQRGLDLGPFHMEAARLLISEGADVNAVDDEGTHCLTLALSYPRVQRS